MGLGPAGPVIGLTDAKSKTGALLNVTPEGESSFTLFKGKGREGRAQMVVSPSGSPDITLADANGFEMDLGSAGTVNSKTGATEQTSAASIVIFGNDEKRHVIWQAPRSWRLGGSMLAENARRRV